MGKKRVMEPKSSLEKMPNLKRVTLGLGKWPLPQKKGWVKLSQLEVEPKGKFGEPKGSISGK